MPMDPERYTIQYKGKSTTVRTCGGPVGAFKGLSNEKIRDWKYIDRKNTIVNDCLVTNIEA